MLSANLWQRSGYDDYRGTVGPVEKRNRRLTVALTMTVVAICAVVTMAAEPSEFTHFDTVVAKHIWLTNDMGSFVVTITTDDNGGGYLTTKDANGKKLVSLSATTDGSGGNINVYNKTGEAIAQINADEYGNGVVGAFNRKGKGRTLKPGP